MYMKKKLNLAALLLAAALLGACGGQKQDAADILGFCALCLRRNRECRTEKQH